MSNFHICETQPNLFEGYEPQYLSLRDTTLAYSKNSNTTSNHDANAEVTNVAEKPMKKIPCMITNKTTKTT